MGLPFGRSDTGAKTNVSEMEAARERYRPDRVRLLLIAEAPPADLKRFFYFANVRSRDALFLETMRALYADAERAPAPTLRAHKELLLRRFQRDGLFLLDAYPEPMPIKVTPAGKQHLIGKALPQLCARVSEICCLRQPVILIAHSVYRAAAETIQSAGINVVNTEPICFPSSGHALEFRQQFERALRVVGWTRKSSGVF